MTKTELIHTVDRSIVYGKRAQLRRSSADVYSVFINGNLHKCLQSYATQVAVLDNCGTCYAFDTYSATTIQHIHKFAQDYGNGVVVWLCKMSRDRKAEFAERSANDYENTINQGCW
jgi:hypothetical protein